MIYKLCSLNHIEQFLIFGYCISFYSVWLTICWSLSPSLGLLKPILQQFKRNIVLKLGILYLLIPHYISWLHFKKKCWLLHLHLWLGQSEEKISIVLTFLVVKFNCLKTSCVLTFLTYRFYFLLNLTIFFFTYFFWNVFFDLIWQPWSL